MQTRITIKGVDYPCRLTMGAMRRFKAETGKDVGQMGNDVSLMGVLLWACVASACKADGIEFSDSLDEFSDKVEVSDLTAFAQQFTERPEKKTK